MDNNQNPVSYCSNCGSPIYEGTKFCGSCGTPVPDQDQDENTVVLNETPVESSYYGAAPSVTPEPAQAPQPEPYNFEVPQPEPDNPTPPQPYEQPAPFNPTPQPPVEQQPAPFNPTSQQPAPYGNPQAPFYGAPQPVKKKKKWLPILIAAVSVTLVGLIVAGIFLYPVIFPSTQSLLEQKRYSEAYEKAEANEKHDVVAENVTAYVCEKEVIDDLKDSDSFILKEIYYDEDRSILVLVVSANNSYGDRVSNYWYFNYDSDDKDFEYRNSVSDLEREEYSIYDDEDEENEKLLNNISRIIIKGVIDDDSNKVSKESVDRINTLFKEGQLNNISLLNINFKTSDDD